MSVSWWSALVVTVCLTLVREPAPVVRVAQGLVRGALSQDRTHHLYSGVHYATVNKTNRFQAPLPPTTWDGIFDAIEENSRCPQKMIGSIIAGDEDCLTLNVYTPVRRKPAELLPVMVFIHGGSFLEGTGAPFLYGGDFFVQHGVVFVAINYRLNVEGFLCLGIREAPGNAGLKDQIAALYWIRENIKAFGGDPDNVTLFGESAGAVSTSYLVLAPAARGLFHKAILQSGSTLAPWALQHDPIKTASALVKELGYNTKDPYEIHRILSERSAGELINAIRYTRRKSFITAETLFVPCVERQIPGVEAVLTRHPAEVIRAGSYHQVPMVIGYNDQEGIHFAALHYGSVVGRDVDVSETLQPDLVFPTERDRNETVDSLQRHYFSEVKENHILDMVELYSDLHFKVPCARESQLYLLTNEKPIYFYQFRYSGLLNMPKIVSGVWARGASHADELFYMFRPHLFPLPHRFLETRMLHKMITLWTNFAKYSNPTPKTTSLLPVLWRPSRDSNPVSLVLDAQLSTARLWEPTSLALWSRVYSRYQGGSTEQARLTRPDMCRGSCEAQTNLYTLLC